MWKRFLSIRATKSHLKLSHRYRNVRISFFCGQLHMSIARKRGSPPVKFLDENECQHHDLHDDAKKIGG